MADIIGPHLDGDETVLDSNVHVIIGFHIQRAGLYLEN
jgi:hypothetical protein